MGKLIYMRHFLTEAYKDNIYMGQSDYAICNTVIINKDALSEMGSCLLLSSTLLRARQTANYIIEQFSNINFTIKLLSELVERGLGDFEGKEKSVVKQNTDFFSNGNLKFELTPPNGEAFCDFHERIKKAYTKIEFAKRENNVLVISHLQALRMLYFIATGNEGDYSKWYDINYKHGEMVIQSIT